MATDSLVIWQQISGETEVVAGWMDLDRFLEEISHHPGDWQLFESKGVMIFIRQTLGLGSAGQYVLAWIFKKEA